MKKLLLLLIALSMVLGLCGCCTCDCAEQLASLQQEVSSLKEQLDKQKDTAPAESTPIESTPVESSPIESTPIETTPVESAPIESTPIESVSADDIDIALLEVLTNQANSNNYTQCYAVAECEYATEDHLKAVANYAVTYGKTDLAAKVIANPNTTSAVMEKLSTSTVYSILFHVAESSKANEASLLKVASYAVTYGKTDLAAKVIANPNTTMDVLIKLSTSSYSNVANLAHEAIEQLPN